MKIRWIFNALAAMEAVLCPALCLMYAFCGLALWTQTVYFCPLLGAVLAALLKKSSPELALLLALAACAAVLLALVRGVETVTAFVREVMQWGGVESALFAPLFKTVAIALISRTGADLCRDAGEGAMASLVETAGAFGAVVVSLPLFGAVWELLSGMI